MTRYTPRSVLRLLASVAAAALMLGLIWRCGGITPRGPGSARASRVPPLPLEAEQLHGIELDSVVADVNARFAAKQELARALLAGRVTLMQAVARYRQLSTSRLVNGDELSEEAVCRGVIVHAEYLLRDQLDDPPEALSTLCRRVDEHLAGLSRAGK